MQEYDDAGERAESGWSCEALHHDFIAPDGAPSLVLASREVRTVFDFQPADLNPRLYSLALDGTPDFRASSCMSSSFFLASSSDFCF